MKPFYLLLPLLVVTFLASFTHTQKVAKPQKTIITGADQPSQYLTYLKGKRIGMLVNQTSIIGKSHSVDSLLSMVSEAMPVTVPKSTTA